MTAAVSRKLKLTDDLLCSRFINVALSKELLVTSHVCGRYSSKHASLISCVDLIASNLNNALNTVHLI